MTKLFWTFVVVDAVLLLTLSVLSITDTRSGDGQVPTTLIFFVLVPAIVIGLAVAMFLNAPSSVWRIIALVIVAGPGLLLAGARLNSAWIDHGVRENARGRGYFSGSALKEAGAAVVRRDVGALRAVAPRADINEVGTHDMTLMRLAVEQAFGGTPLKEGQASSPDIIRALLDLHADPNPGLAEATKLPDPAILTLLLERGADPNFTPDGGHPVIFEWLGVMSLANFRVLLDHGANVNVRDRNGGPLIVRAAEADRWDLTTLLIERGADTTQGDAQGRTAGDVVASRMAGRSDGAGDSSAGLARIRALLESATSRQQR